LAFHSGREADHSPPSSTEVNEWVELYLHSPNTQGHLHFTSNVINKEVGGRVRHLSSIRLTLHSNFDRAYPDTPISSVVFLSPTREATRKSFKQGKYRLLLNPYLLTIHDQLGISIDNYNL
jgi:hypothetical protein